MKRLDKVGVDYLILMAKDIGFTAVSVDSKESESCAPRVAICFEQTRELASAATSPASLPMGLMSNPAISPTGTHINDAISGIPKMGTIVGTNPPGKFSTLDDEEGPACSTSNC
jgi:hypothetical protein